jgi:hypothetical protein
VGDHPSREFSSDIGEANPEASRVVCRLGEAAKERELEIKPGRAGRGGIAEAIMKLIDSTSTTACHTMRGRVGRYSTPIPQFGDVI